MLNSACKFIAFLGDGDYDHDRNGDDDDVLDDYDSFDTGHEDNYIASNGNRHVMVSLFLSIFICLQSYD